MSIRWLVLRLYVNYQKDITVCNGYLRNICGFLLPDALYHELSNLLFFGKVRFLLTNKLQGRFGTRNRIFWHTCAKSCAKAEVLVFPNGVKKVLKAVFNS